MNDMLIEAEELNLCDHCLGRIFAMRGHGLTNAERGRALRVIYAMKHNITYSTPDKCTLCRGLFDNLDRYASHIARVLEKYEFDTFMIGSRFPQSVLEKEKSIHEKYGNMGEPVNREFNREVGKKVMHLTGKEATIKNPDIVVIVDVEYDDVKLEIKPLLIYGRYKKLVRGIPQTKWPSGKYKESVEELIAHPIMQLTGGSSHELHGMGREDIDARMLGNGRPFIIEIKNPVRRKFDLKEMERKINEYALGKIEVELIRFASRSDVVKLKSAAPKKRYEVGITVDASEEELNNALKSLVGEIRQRTPTRVAHRRADKIRFKKVYETKLKKWSKDVKIVEILAQSGTYIKELMHGDGGRTVPSLAGLLGKKVEVVWLDVIEILDSEEN